MDKTAKDAKCKVLTRKTMQSWKAVYREIGPYDLVGGSQKPGLATGEGAGFPPNITAIWTREGWLYVAGVLDLFSRALIGWAMDRVQDEQFVERARLLAMHRRQPLPGLLHHSDRGSQYTSGTYRQVLDRNGVLVSMSRTGNCYDNAPMESFWATLKRECMMGTLFSTRDLARQAIFVSIETYYNRQRRHSTLGYLSPFAFEELLI